MHPRFRLRNCRCSTSGRGRVGSRLLKRFFLSEIGAAVVWVVCTLMLAALLAPWVYQGGKWLAAEAAAKELPAILEWLGAACGRSKFVRFFDRTLMFSALLLLPLLFRRIHGLRAGKGDDRAGGLRRVPLKSAMGQIVVGCIISGGILWGLALMLDVIGAYGPKAAVPGFGKLLSKSLVPAVAAALIEEWLFRGVLLGLWLRYARPALAVAGISLLFAFLHFLTPPAGAVIADPGNAFSGFLLLEKILLHFTDPLFFVTDFSTLLLVGLILAWARVRTGALWFSIGLHAGWIFAFKNFNLVYQKIPGHPLFPWGVGDSLRSGLVPLATLGLTAVVCHYALRAAPSFNRA
jgi:membrane protease YdiL (CAAX protease family)